MDWTGLARYSRVFIMVQASVQLSFYASTNQRNYGNAATVAGAPLLTEHNSPSWNHTFPYGEALCYGERQLLKWSPCVYKRKKLLLLMASKIQEAVLEYRRQFIFSDGCFQFINIILELTVLKSIFFPIIVSGFESTFALL